MTWESRGHLRALVDSMNRNLAADVELIVVDNGSSDDPSGAAAEWRGATRFIALERNLGFGAAANAGTAAARRPDVALLNPDTLLLDASLNDLVAVARTRCALAGPRLLNADGSVQPSASGPPVGIWPWLGAVVPGALQPAALQARTEPWRLERTTRVAWLTGACLAAPRDVLRRLGPFDPAIHLYGEDMDLGLRAARARIESWFCPDVCQVVHVGGASAAIRYPEGSEPEVARSRRVVVRRAYGGRREHAGWLAHRLNLRLRATAKRAMGRDAARERAALTASRSERAGGRPPAR